MNKPVSEHEQWWAKVCTRWNPEIENQWKARHSGSHL